MIFEESHGGAVSRFAELILEGIDERAHGRRIELARAKEERDLRVQDSG